MLRSLVGSEMCIRDSINAEYGKVGTAAMPLECLSCTTSPQEANADAACSFKQLIQHMVQGVSDRSSELVIAIPHDPEHSSYEELHETRPDLEAKLQEVLTACVRLYVGSSEFVNALFDQMMEVRWEETSPDPENCYTLYNQGVAPVISEKYAEWASSGTGGCDEGLNTSQHETCSCDHPLMHGVEKFCTDDAEYGALFKNCLLYTSDAADEEDSVDLGGRRIIKKKKKKKNTVNETIKF
eukprot:TRINITY_DN18534_c0_g1_i9.p1 TRINITY_DN18534_c0_g1~~TRINITY_DN18534_c0_g1_i9.p1  ORF type:complete len:240 (+),score=82.54 TRINITY_DN18534_c0_g1_i9:136-855(+)